MKKYMLLMLPLLVLVTISCSDDVNTSDGDKPVIPEPTIPPVTVKNVTWADIAFPEGLSTIADPNTGISDPVTTTPTVVDTVIYDNNSDKHKVTIIIKDSIDAGVGDDGWGSAVVTGPVPFFSTLSSKDSEGIWDNASFVRHNAIPKMAQMAMTTLPAVNENNSATWVLKDNGTTKSGYFVSINHLGKNSKAYKALPADDKYTYRLDISTEDPFAKGEILSSKELTYAEAIVKLPNTIKPDKPDFITADQIVTLVTYKNTKKGYEIRVSDINNYTKFRTYLKARWFTGGQYFGKSHPKGTPMGDDVNNLDAPYIGAFRIAVPELDASKPADQAEIDNATAAWAFVDGDNYVSFIFHGSKSPSNPLPATDKNIFIIEVMEDDPMWFMPLKDDNAK